MVISQEGLCNCKLIFKWTPVWSLPGGWNTLSPKEQKKANQTVPGSTAVKSEEWRPSRMFEQIGHLPASDSEWSDSYQRPHVQCPTAELQGWGVCRVKGWIGVGLKYNKQRLENSKVKEWLSRCKEMCLCSHNEIRTYGDRIPRPQSQLNRFREGKVCSWPGCARKNGRTPQSVLVQRMDFRMRKLSFIPSSTTSQFCDLSKACSSLRALCFFSKIAFSPSSLGSCKY